jgi:hypothetical protein
LLNKSDRCGPRFKLKMVNTDSVDIKIIIKMCGFMTLITVRRRVCSHEVEREEKTGVNTRCVEIRSVKVCYIVNTSYPTS